MVGHGRVGLAVLVAGGLLAVTQAWAGDGIPERRVVAHQDADMPGGDIRSIFNTELERCIAQCLDDRRCVAFTFNARASACFLKDKAGATAPYKGAISGRLQAPSNETRALAERRVGDLGFLPYGLIDEAARVTAEIGVRYPIGERQPAALRNIAAEARAAGDPAAAMGASAALASLTDATDDWLALARDAATLAGERKDAPAQVGVDAGAAAVAGYLRAGDAATRAAALELMAVTLEQRGYGRPTIDALKLAQSLQPGQRTEAALARARGLYGMRVTGHTVDSDAVAPRICLTFSEPVAKGSVDFADYVRVAEQDLPVEAKDNQACVEGVTHGERYAVTVRAGLPAASGEVVQKSATLDVYVRDRSPALRFQGRAYVLPKSGRATIPLVSVNVDEVDLRIHRVAERNLLPIIQDGSFGRALSSYSESQIANLTGEQVWTGTVEVRPELNRDVTTAVAIGEAVTTFVPGAYVISARLPNSEEWQRSLATQWFVVTDIGLATLSGDDGLHVFTRALASAAPTEGVKLRLLAANNQVLAEATTDARGYARFAAGLLRGKGGNEAALLTAATDGDFAFLHLTAPAFDLTDRGVDGRPAPKPIDVFLSTERGVYRPGETIHATVLARDARAHALPDVPLTAMLYRPDGVEHSRMLLTDGLGGGYAYRADLEGTAQRGTWRLAIHADPKAPVLAATTVLVEDFVPERLDFELALPDGPLPAQPQPVELTARYLYGAPAAGLAIEGEAYVASTTAHPDHPGYSFGLADETSERRAEPIAAGTQTDTAGHARVLLRLPQMAAQAGLRELTAVLRVRDATGRQAERKASRLLLPDGVRVGIKPLFDGAAEEGGLARFELIALGADGARAAVAKATWTLSKVETTYQWYQVDDSWSYEPVTTRSRIASGETALGTDAPAVIEAAVDWGRYELMLRVPDAPFAAASIAFNAGWYAAAGRSETPDVLQVGLDQPAYSIGDIAKLRLVAREAGKVLVAVVDTGLIDMRALDVAAGESVVELPVTEAWGAGAYVAATLVRPMDIVAGHNPARALGLAWAAVDPGPRKLQASFEVATEAAPRAALPAVLRIDGLAAGEQAYATVAAVDLGILNLTGFEAPAPEEWYFGQRRLGVGMRDLYGRLIDGNAGAVGRLRSGGDGGFGGFAATPPAQDLVAFFTGPVQADGQGRVALNYDVPDFDGTVRLMAVVWTASGVGHAVADVLVRDPIVVSVAMPRFLAPDDTSRLRLDLDQISGPAGQVAVAVEPDPNLEITAAAQTVTLADGGHATLQFPVTARAIGDAAIRIVVTTPDGKTLTKRRTLAVRANDPVVMRQQRLSLAAGQSYTLDAAAFDGLRPDGARATLAIGPFAGIDVPRLLLELDRYPYGCTEQVASRALPLLYLEEVAAAMGLVPRADVRPRIETAIRRVLANQSSSGGFGLWGAGFGDLWLDAYVTDFLGRARAAGYEVPAVAFRQALDNLRNRIAYAGDFERGGEALAYGLLVLAREGIASIGDLRYYADAKAEALATPLAKAQLGAALALYGEPARADSLFRLAALQTARQDTGADARLWRADYGSALRDAAGVLALATAAGSQAVDRADLTDQVARAMRDRPVSTQEMSWALLAARSLARDAAIAGLAVDGTPLTRPILPLIRGVPANPLVIENRGDAAVEAVLTTTGVPTAPVPAGGDGYTLTRKHFTLEGAPVVLDQVKLNDRIVVVLDVKAERDQRGRLMLDSPLPAGFEIDNPRLVSAGDVAALDWLQTSGAASHSEFRSDRFLAALELGDGDAARLAFMVRAVSPGRFHYPAARVEDMYRPAFQARTAAEALTVAGP
jgi:uncharacterized protein YfaS (alpha-2-macroglobulin family)